MKKAEILLIECEGGTFGLDHHIGTIVWQSLLLVAKYDDRFTLNPGVP
jgi:hypothetical protein